PDRLKLTAHLLPRRTRINSVSVAISAGEGEQRVVMLVETVSACLGIMPAFHHAERSLPPGIGGSPVLRGHQALIGGAQAFKPGAIEMVRRRKLEQYARADGMHPGKIAEDILF